MVLMALIIRQKPSEGPDQVDEWREYYLEELERLKVGSPPKYITDLVALCLETQPSARPHFKGILSILNNSQASKKS